MAIVSINSQNMTMYVLDSLGATTPTVVAIQAGDVVGCPQSIGALEETRTVTEYRCMSSDESAKALGSIQRGNVEIGLLFNPDDNEGQDALRTAWAANSEVTVGIELDNSLGVNGTIFVFNGGISGVSTGIVQDEAVT